MALGSSIMVNETVIKTIFKNYFVVEIMFIDNKCLEIMFMMKQITYTIINNNFEYKPYTFLHTIHICDNFAYIYLSILYILF